MLLNTLTLQKKSTGNGNGVPIAALTALWQGSIVWLCPRQGSPNVSSGAVSLPQRVLVLSVAAEWQQARWWQDPCPTVLCRGLLLEQFIVRLPASSLCSWHFSHECVCLFVFSPYG